MPDAAPSDLAPSRTFDYLLPSLGADMDVGRVVEWKVAVGDDVHRGDVMAIVETEKSDIDVEIWHDGTVEEFLVELHDEIPVGTPLIRLRDAATAPEPPPLENLERSARPTRDRAQVSAGVVVASPLARRLAAERGIDLTTLIGSGPGGAIVERDLAHGAPVATPPRTRSTETMRTMIAERMSRANREIPHYYLQRDVDLGTAIDWLAERNETRPVAERILPAALYIRAVALAAARHPQLNGHWIDDHFEPGEAVNVAMAISLRAGGLIAPNIADADQRSLEEIMAALTELVGAARTGTLRGSWMTGSTITITNLGDTGADLVLGVISPPEVALVGFGRTTHRPWVVDDEIVIRPIVTVSLAADHRATDGAVGSRFLTTLTRLLEHPEEL